MCHPRPEAPGESGVSFCVSARERSPFESVLARAVRPVDTLVEPDDRPRRREAPPRVGLYPRDFVRDGSRLRTQLLTGTGPPVTFDAFYHTGGRGDGRPRTAAAGRTRNIEKQTVVARRHWQTSGGRTAARPSSSRPGMRACRQSTTVTGSNSCSSFRATRPKT